MAVRDADIIATDTFISIGKKVSVGEWKPAFLPNYQVDTDIMSLRKRDAIFMHCLPAKRMEVTTDVIDASSRWYGKKLKTDCIHKRRSFASS